MILKHILPRLKINTYSLMHRLFLYMIIMIVMILIFITISAMFLGKLSLGKAEITEDMNMQMISFEQDISTSMENLAGNGLVLSRVMSDIITDYLNTNGQTFSSIDGSNADLSNLASQLYTPLSEHMFMSGCTGAFVLLESSAYGSSNTDFRSGIYINNYNNTMDKGNLLLYRGNSSLAKGNDSLQLHRKWRLEFDAKAIPEYSSIISKKNLTPERDYLITKPTTLPGTSSKVMLLMVPIVSDSGELYGICGFEMTDYYFKERFAQPSSFQYLSCGLSAFEDGVIKASEGFSTGILGGNYTPLEENFNINVSLSDELERLKGDTYSYHGLIKSIKLSESTEDMVLTVALPDDYYKQMIRGSSLRSFILLFLIVFFAIFCSVYLSRKFMHPVADAINAIKSRTPAKYNIRELDELIEHVSLNEAENDVRYAELLSQKVAAETKLNEIDRQLKQLITKKEKSISMDNYAHFKAELDSLTPKERDIFMLYSKGLTPKEIVESEGFTMNTLKYHNKNMFAKLGVSNRKELMQFIIIMNNEISGSDEPAQ